jgi:hypothetical protein
MNSVSKGWGSQFDKEASTRFANSFANAFAEAVQNNAVISGGVATPGLITVARYIMSKGGTRAAGAGVGGVVAGESGGNPEILQGGGGGGAGLLQWTPESSAFPIQPIITGNAGRDMAVQLVDMMAYIGSRGGLGRINAAGAAGGPMGAAYAFSAMEAPAVPGSDIRPGTVASLYAAGYDSGGWLPTGATLAVNNTGAPEWVSPGGPCQIEIILSMDASFAKATGLTPQQLKNIKYTVRTQGGGDVQKAFGNG